MCLAIPGKILEIQEQGTMRAARVQFGGIVRQVSLDFVPEAGLGDNVAASWTMAQRSGVLTPESLCCGKTCRAGRREQVI